MSLVPLQDAKAHLLIPDDDTDHDGEVQTKLDDAEAILLAYINPPPAIPWTDADLPFQVRAAILVLLTNLYENRGNDMKADESVWQAIERMLRPSGLRDPALA